MTLAALARAPEAMWRRAAWFWAVLLSTVLLLLAVADGSGWLSFSNEVLLMAAQGRANHRLDVVMVVISTLGSTEVTYVLMFGLCVWGRRGAGESRLARWAPLAILVAANVVELGLKLVVPAVGPPFAVKRGIDITFPAATTTYSFPSGHTLRAAMVFGLAGLRFFRRSGEWLWLIWATGITWLVAASRVYLGVHWPADVAGGLLLGGVGLSLALALAPRATLGLHSALATKKAAA